MLHVYIADLVGLETIYDEKLNMLHRSRAEKLSSYKMSADKVRSLGAGLLLEKGLEDYLKTNNLRSFQVDNKKDAGNMDACKIPRDEDGRCIIEYGYGPQGKPYLKDYPEVYFSLSHSGDYAVLAIADSEVGIDVQEFRGYSEKIAKRFYHKEEVQRLDVIADERQKEELFYKIWSGKEAFIKYTGKGMSQDLRSFHVDLPKERILMKEQTVASYKEIMLDADEYSCGLVFDKTIQKIDKIVKIQL